MGKKFLKQIELGERTRSFQYLNAFSEKYKATWYKWAKIVIRTEGEEIDEEETQATIKLLRAAPDLLEALEAFEEALTVSPIDFIPTKELYKASELARAAIKKALS